MAENTILEGASGGRDENMISSFAVSYHAKSIGEVTTVGHARFHGLVEQGRTQGGCPEISHGRCSLAI